VARHGQGQHRRSRPFPKTTRLSHRQPKRPPVGTLDDGEEALTIFEGRAKRFASGRIPVAGNAIVAVREEGATVRTYELNVTVKVGDAEVVQRVLCVLLFTRIECADISAH